MITRHRAKRLFEEEFIRLANINIHTTRANSTIHTVHRPPETFMAEKTVAAILTKTLENLPKFVGKPEQNAEAWLDELTNTFRMADITETQALKIIPTFLAGPAKNWFNENHAVFESWTTFKAEFINVYTSPSTKQLASQRLRHRQQGIDETVIEYYTNILKLCKIVDPEMTNATKLDYLYHGLRPSLLKDVFRKQPQTPAEFLEHARHEEVLETFMNTSANTGDHQQSITEQNYQSTVFHNYPGTQYTTAPQPLLQMPYSLPTQSHNALHYRKRTIRCYKCNRIGHIARNCMVSKN